MDQLTRFLVYNKVPISKNNMNYEAMRTEKKQQNERGGEIDKRLLLLSPDLGRMSDDYRYRGRRKIGGHSRPLRCGSERKKKNASYVLIVFQQRNGADSFGTSQVERRWFDQIEWLLSTLTEIYLVEYSQTSNLAPVFMALKSTDYVVFSGLSKLGLKKKNKQTHAR
ncbi:jg4775 [Pararge aegeria aegeria]|uniref:Jg4775 protein n=1 Tax=Pararge aegeria aegeria TaxID=348720 RepID=A0A8S4R7M2_9NEOP|nr:jg4775 [Pararge aegeria aegeria]